MTKTEQVPEWAAAAVLLVLVVTACIGFLLFDKVTEGSFMPLVTGVIGLVLGKKLGEKTNGSGTGNGTPLPSADASK